MTGGWIDVTRPLDPDTEVYPGDPEVRFRRAGGADASFTISEIRLGSHAGTHVDAPCHLFPGEAGVDEISPDVLCGPARLIVPAGNSVDVAALAAGQAAGQERLLFRTLHPAGPSFLEPDAAAWLRDRGVRLVGWDRPSIDPIGDADLPAHRVLLGAGIVVIEALDLQELPGGDYELVALPLRLTGLDGAPARVLVRPRG